MRLTIHNRSKQHAELHVSPPLRDGRPVCSPVLQIDAGCTMEITGRAREVTAILDDIKRFGATPRHEADRFDAMRPARDPAWRGLVTEVLGDG